MNIQIVAETPGLAISIQTDNAREAYDALFMIERRGSGVSLQENPPFQTLEENAPYTTAAPLPPTESGPFTAEKIGALPPIVDEPKARKRRSKAEIEAEAAAKAAPVEETKLTLVPDKPVEATVEPTSTTTTEVVTAPAEPAALTAAEINYDELQALTLEAVGRNRPGVQALLAEFGVARFRDLVETQYAAWKERIVKV